MDRRTFIGTGLVGAAAAASSGEAAVPVKEAGTTKIQADEPVFRITMAGSLSLDSRLCWLCKGNGDDFNFTMRHYDEFPANEEASNKAGAPVTVPPVVMIGTRDAIVKRVVSMMEKAFATITEPKGYMEMHAEEQAKLKKVLNGRPLLLVMPRGRLVEP